MKNNKQSIYQKVQNCKEEAEKPQETHQEQVVDPTIPNIETIITVFQQKVKWETMRVPLLVQE